MKNLFTLVLILFLGMTISAFAQDEDYDNIHELYVKNFKGTKTCLKCHEAQARDVFHSAHYQWKGTSPDLVGKNDDKTMHGKFIDINDFCTNPGGSWIDIIKNKEGKVIADGCSKCHIGFGKKPGEKLTREELENIDCLMCHAPGYSRKIVEENGIFKWIPNDDSDTLTARAQNVMKATSSMCLKCHAGGGGGTNFKRGDMESTHFDADENLDVHFAQGMMCTECHTTKNHRIAGRGNDLATTDLPGVKVACENCHDAKPHESKRLNAHTSTLHCTVCHIPNFARTDATDMYRDWEKVKQHHNGKWEAEMKMEKNVTPAYTWWNGKTKYIDFQKPIKVDNGVIHIAQPAGDIKDKTAKIYPFKLHKAKLPVIKNSKLVTPIQVNTIFETGNVDKAVIQGAKNYFNVDIKKGDYEFMTFDRYMGLFHEVVNNDTVLKCSDCHTNSGGRLDWKALGYSGDPKKAGGRFNKK